MCINFKTATINNVCADYSLSDLRVPNGYRYLIIKTRIQEILRDSSEPAMGNYYCDGGERYRLKFLTSFLAVPK